MAFTWADTFVAPNASGGMDSGSYLDADEFPFTRTDNCYVQDTASGTSNPTFTFNMSVGPGDKKGFRIWVQWYCDNSNGYRIDTIRLVNTAGPTTLWTNSSPGISVLETAGAEVIYTIDIPNSAFSGDPAINSLRVEFDVTNLNSGNNRLRFAGIRLSKSPFTAAQEQALPTDLVGQNYSVYSAAGLSTLGAANDESLVVIPDGSGRGYHLIRLSGTGAVYKTADGGYIDFPDAAPTRFATKWETRVTGNHIWHARVYTYDETVNQVVFSTANEFFGTVATPTDPNDKNLLGVDLDGGDDKWVLMSGDGSGGAHKFGGAVSATTWYRMTEWVQDSGNEKMWEDDDVTPVIDTGSGSNNLLVYSFGGRESNERYWEGRITEFWVIDGTGITEGEIDDARDEWVNGPPAGTLLYATGDQTGTDVVNELDATTNLYQSIDDDPGTPTDTDWINNVAREVTKFFDITNMPVDFGTATTLAASIRAGGFNWLTGTLKLYVRIYQSDESTALTNEMLVGTFTANTALANIPITFTGVSAGTKAIWDGARIRFRWSET